MKNMCHEAEPKPWMLQTIIQNKVHAAEERNKKRNKKMQPK